MATTDPRDQTRTLRRNLSLHTLASVSRLLATLDFDQILDSIVRAAVELIGASRGFLFLLDDSGVLSLRVGRSASGAEITASSAPEISMTLVQQALRERRCVYVQDVKYLPGLAAESSIVRLGIGSALCLPMVLTEIRSGAEASERRRNWQPTRDVLGVIYTDKTDAGKPLTAEDYALFQAMGNLAAAALVNAAIYQDAIVDGLTGLAHRRHFERTLGFEVERARLENRPLSLLMLDLDFFKHINDSLGHAGGDEVLRRAGRLLRTRTRPGDVVARYGGEEFAVILPDCKEVDALRVGEHLRTTLKEHFATEGPAQVTMSVGVAAWNSGTDVVREDLVRRADAALYESKRAGRDRTTAWSAAIAEAGQADELHGIFSGEPSRDYRTMKALLQFMLDGEEAETEEWGRLKRALARARESVSGRRAALYRVEGGQPVLWLQDGGPIEAWEERAARGATAESKAGDGVWAGPLRRSGQTYGILVVSGSDAGQALQESDRALLDAISPQLALLILEAQGRNS